MQKKLIALAVAGLVSAPAFAQSNVQVYGVMDLGFRSLSSSEGVNKADRLNSISKDGQSSSRLGFRGTEDLGNGLKAFFTIEQDLTPDNGAAGGNGRQAFVGLETGAGRVWLGKDFNPNRALVSGVDPFGATGIANNQQIFEQTTRFNNAVFYRSPSFGGVTINAAYSTSVDTEESVNFKSDSSGVERNIKAWALTAAYKNGPLTAGIGYERQSDFDRPSVTGNLTGTNGRTSDFSGKQTRWNLVGSYDFGVVDLRAAYGQTKLNDGRKSGDFGDDTKSKSFMLGAIVPVSQAGQILASYTRTKIDEDGSSDAKANMWALGYSHNLSKRTAVYGTYAKISTNNAAEGGFSLGTSNPAAYNDGSGLGGSSRTAFTSGFNVGVRHNF